MERSSKGQYPPWLIMLYLAGDNNLSEEMVLSLQDLLAEGVPADARILAQFDPSGVGLEAQRYRFGIEADGTVATATRRTSSEIGASRTRSAGSSSRRDAGRDSGRSGSHAKVPDTIERHRDKDFDGSDVNTGNPATIADFVRWAARHDKKGQMQYLLVLSGHGAGTSADFLLKDENAQDALSMTELRTALQVATEEIRSRTRQPKRKIDILGFDACFMSMGEVAYEVREFAEILVGAEGMEPAFGWPYRRLLAKAKDRKKHLGPQELASEIVQEYVTHYSDFDRTAGRSADLWRSDWSRFQAWCERSRPSLM